MSEVQCQVPEHQALSPPRSADSRLPSGFRVVHVPVPETIFNHAKAQAYLSGMRFAVFVAQVLRDARPYQANRPPQPQCDAPAQELVEAGHGQH